MGHIVFNDETRADFLEVVNSSSSISEMNKKLKKLEQNLKHKQKYEIGQLVKYKDGDGRPHQIHKVEWDPGLGRPNDGFYIYTFVDNGKAMESSIVPFVDKFLLDDVIDWLVEHGNDYLVNDRYELPNGEMSREWLKIKSDMFDDLRKHFGL